MYGKLFHCHVTDIFDNIKTGLTGIADYALFLSSTNVNFQDNEIQRILEAFVNLRCIVWHSVAKDSEQLKQIATYKVFEAYPNLNESLVAMTYTSFIDEELAYASAAAWVSSKSCTELADLLNYSGRANLAISLIPSNSKSADAWFLIANGRKWQHTLNLFNFRLRMGASYLDSYDSILLDYIKLTQNIGGLPVCVCYVPDTEVKKLLLILGKKDQLLAGANRLKEFYSNTEESEFQKWIERGISLV